MRGWKLERGEKEKIIFIIYRGCNCLYRKINRINKLLELVRGFCEVDRYKISL